MRIYSNGLVGIAEIVALQPRRGLRHFLLVVA
jgi:hypothetical protein